MNRQYKREMKRQEGRRKAPRPVPSKAAGAPQRRERANPRDFVKQVIDELQKVNWPTRQEVVQYSTVVLVAVIVIAAVISALDFVFAKAVLALFGVNV